MRGKTILRIDVRTKALEETTNGVRGVATVTFGNSFAVRNISIVESKAGNLFMSMPSYKMKTVDENGKPQFKDIAYPVTKAFREKLQEKILQSYESGEDSCFEV
jgi:DNA-binding cell septation regulator SpoVG